MAQYLRSLEHPSSGSSQNAGASLPEPQYQAPSSLDLNQLSDQNPATAFSMLHSFLTHGALSPPSAPLPDFQQPPTLAPPGLAQHRAQAAQPLEEPNTASSTQNDYTYFAPPQQYQDNAQYLGLGSASATLAGPDSYTTFFTPAPLGNHSHAHASDAQGSSQLDATASGTRQLSIWDCLRSDPMELSPENLAKALTKDGYQKHWGNWETDPNLRFWLGPHSSDERCLTAMNSPHTPSPQDVLDPGWTDVSTCAEFAFID